MLFMRKNRLLDFSVSDMHVDANVLPQPVTDTHYGHTHDFTHRHMAFWNVTDTHAGIHFRSTRWYPHAIPSHIDMLEVTSYPVTCTFLIPT